MFQTLNEDKGGTRTRTVPQPFADDSLPIELREHVRRLRTILPVISVSVMALTQQNAELDGDIAAVLSQHACLPLDEEIEHLAVILASLTTRSRQQGVRV